MITLQANAMETTVVAPRASVAATNTRWLRICHVCHCNHCLKSNCFDMNWFFQPTLSWQFVILSALPDSPVWSSGSGAIKEIRLHEAEMRVSETFPFFWDEVQNDDIRPSDHCCTGGSLKLGLESLFLMPFLIVFHRHLILMRGVTCAFGLPVRAVVPHWGPAHPSLKGWAMLRD